MPDSDYDSDYDFYEDAIESVTYYAYKALHARSIGCTADSFSVEQLLKSLDTATERMRRVEQYVHPLQ